MNDRVVSVLRLFAIAFCFMVSAGTLRNGAWISWLLSIALILVVALPKERYPVLTTRNRTISFFVLVTLMVLLFPLQWKLNA